MATLTNTIDFAAQTRGIKVGTQDNATQRALAAAESQIAKRLGWPRPGVGLPRTLRTATYTARLNGPDALNSRALLPNPHFVTSVTSINQDSNWTFGSSTLVTSTDYELMEDGEVWTTPLGTTSWICSPKSIQVIFVAGFEPDDENTDITDLLDAIYRQAAIILTGWRTGSNTTSISAGRTSRQTNVPKLSEDVLEQLRPYRSRGAWLQ